MIVSRETFEEFLADCEREPLLAVDTETTGLYPYKDDHIFSLVFGTKRQNYYIDVSQILPQGVPDKEFVESFKEFIKSLQTRIFDVKEKIFFFHNAKFDLAMLAKEGIKCRGFVHDTKSVFRLINNEAFLKFSLENCAKVIGAEKSYAVEDFILEHELWDWVQIPGKAKREKKMYFQHVPIDVIVPYALKDAEITRKLGCWQLEELARLEVIAENLAQRPYASCYLNECHLTKTVFEMERLGVKINRPYCKSVIKTLEVRLEGCVEKFKELTGHEFKASGKLFEDIFKEEKLVYGDITSTGKRNASFDSEVLATFTHPAAKCVLDYRDTKSTLDFFQGFLFHADHEAVIHTNFNQDGTVTGRFSSSNPNLQNLKKDDEESLKQEIVTRRAIVPRPGFFFAMFDYDQMEYRLLLDMTGSMKLINKVLGGLDVHQATADLAKITRKQAKTTNFATIYGSGLTALAASLHTSMEDAARIRDAIFDAAPEIRDFIENEKNQADSCGYIVNWFGRRCRFPYVASKGRNIRLSYKATNSKIQGGCADVVKIAMNRIAGYLADKKSKMVLTIHDEVVIETHESEAYVLPEIKKIMEEAYPHRHLPLTVGVEHSFTSLADKVEGYPPDGPKAGDKISREQSHPGFAETSEH